MMINHGKILALNGWFFEHGISWVLFNQHWLVVWNMNFMTFHILGIIIPTDFHIFKRGRYTTNQNTVKFGFVQNWDITIDYTIKGNFGYRMIFDKAWNFDGFGVSMSVNPCKQNPWCFFCFVLFLFWDWERLWWMKDLLVCFGASLNPKIFSVSRSHKFATKQTDVIR